MNDNQPYMNSHLHNPDIDLILPDAGSRARTRADLFEGLRRLGLPDVIVTRLRRLWNQTRPLRERAIAVGRILLDHLDRFLEQNVGLAVGILLGVAIGYLVGVIPLLGPLLQPIATLALGAAGAGIGYGLDHDTSHHSLLHNTIKAAQICFEFVVEAMKSVFTAPKQKNT